MIFNHVALKGRTDRLAFIALFFMVCSGNFFKSIFIDYASVIQIFITLSCFFISIYFFKYKTLYVYVCEAFILFVYVFVYLISTPLNILNISSSLLTLYIVISTVYITVKFGNGKDIIRVIHIVLLLSCVSLLVIYFKNGFFLPKHLDMLVTFDGGLMNRNLTKEIIAYPLFSYYILSSLFKIRINIISPIIGSLLLLISNSRVGLVLCLLSVVCLITLLIKENRIALLIFFSFLCVAAICIFVDDISNHLVGLYWAWHRLSESASIKDPRQNVIDCYINSFNGLKLIFGLHFGGDDICSWKAGVADANTHNSFINGYIHFGIFFPIFILYMVIKIILKSIVDFNFVFVISLFCYFMTAAFESNLFVSYYDALVYSTIFIMLRKRHLSE
ncbi:hypothetical protein [Edwardsiella tarda]|uniref:hypothetical protein n=1 Tax=Edwardsiella tarda TaxID=636 RepID=UPI00351C8CE7